MFDGLLYISIVTFLYKYLKNIIAPSLSLSHIMHTFLARYSSYNFYVHPIQTDIRKRFVLHSGVILWNNLNVTTKLIKSVSYFKHNVKLKIVEKYC